MPLLQPLHFRQLVVARRPTTPQFVVVALFLILNPQNYRRRLLTTRRALKSGSGLSRGRPPTSIFWYPTVPHLTSTQATQPRFTVHRPFVYLSTTQIALDVTELSLEVERLETFLSPRQAIDVPTAPQRVRNSEREVILFTRRKWESEAA